MSLLELFCHVDDFCQQFQCSQPQQRVSKTGQKRRQAQLSDSEVMTIVIHFHQSSYRNFKDYYTEHVQAHLKSEFPKLLSYSRFVQLMPRVLLLLWAYTQSICGTCSGISFIDSTALRVCTNRRIQRQNMKNRLLLLRDKLLLRKRNIIETVNNQLKNISQIEHSRHRSPTNFFINVFAAYIWQPKKPAINWSEKQANILALLH